MKRVSLSLVVVVAAAAAVGAGANARASDGSELTVAGVKRTFELFVPAGAPKKAPLLVVLHGRFGTGHQVRTASGFDAYASKDGFVAAYPDGLDKKWFDARQYTLKTKTPPVGSDDVGFILALVDDLVAKGLVDPARVYVVGHSNGAMMALTLACTHADRFAGVGVVAGNLPSPNFPGAACELSRAVPAIFFQGTADPLIPFHGGGVGRDGERGFVASADDTVKVFADKAGCGPGQKRAPVDAVKSDGTTLVIEDRAGCTVPIARAILQEGGHGWPGRPSSRLLRSSQEIDATDAIARFFFEGKAP